MRALCIALRDEKMQSTLLGDHLAKIIPAPVVPEPSGARAEPPHHRNDETRAAFLPPEGGED